MPKSKSIAGRSNKTRSSRLSSRPASNVAFDKQLSTIIELSETEIVQEIIDELMENVLNKCYEVYMNKQIIHFTLHCAQQAFLRLLDFHCYRHNDFNWKEEFWSPDPPPKSSPADSWAAYQVPVHEKALEATPLNSMSKLGINMDNISELGWTFIDEPSESLLEDVDDILEEILRRVDMQAHDPDECESVQSQISTFTRIAEEGEDLRKYMIAAPSRMMFKSYSVKLPRIEQPSIYGDDEMSVECRDTVGKLPPIRTEATYKCRKQQPPPPPPKSKKKR